MANRNGFQFQYAFQRDMWHVHMQISFGAAGAPTLVSGKGVASIEKLATGKYRIHLQDSFAGVMHVSKAEILAAGAPAAPEMVLRDLSQISSQSDPSIDVAMQAAGVDTDPANGNACLMHLILKNTSA